MYARKAGIRKSFDLVAVIFLELRPCRAVAFLKTRVELRSHALHYDLVCLIKRHALLIDALTYECIINVCYRHYPGLERDLLTHELLGVPGAVPSLVMVMGDIDRYTMEFVIVGILKDLIDDPRTFSGVLLHLLEFLGSEPAGLSKDGIIYGDLTQVMHRRGLYYLFAERIGKSMLMVITVAHLINEDPYAFARSVDMTSRRVVATFNHRRHADDQLVVHTYDLLGLFPDGVGLSGWAGFRTLPQGPV